MQNRKCCYFFFCRDEDENRLGGVWGWERTIRDETLSATGLFAGIGAVLKRVYRIRDNADEKRGNPSGGVWLILRSGVIRRKNRPTCGEKRSRKPEAGKERAGRIPRKEVQTTEVALTAKEYAILEKLAANRGQIVTID